MPTRNPDAFDFATPSGSWPSYPGFGWSQTRPEQPPTHAEIAAVRSEFRRRADRATLPRTLRLVRPDVPSFSPCHPGPAGARALRTAALLLVVGWLAVGYGLGWLTHRITLAVLEAIR